MEAARTSENAARYLLPPSVSAFGGAYTINGTWMVGGGHFAFWKKDHIRYRVGGGYGSINMDFYGLGTSSSGGRWSSRCGGCFSVSACCSA